MNEILPLCSGVDSLALLITPILPTILPTILPKSRETAKIPLFQYVIHNNNKKHIPMLRVRSSMREYMLLWLPVNRDVLISCSVGQRKHPSRSERCDTRCEDTHSK